MNRGLPPPTPQSPIHVRVKKLEVLSMGHGARLLALEKLRDRRDGMAIVALVMSLVATLIAVGAFVFRVFR